MKWTGLNELREMYLKFFESKEHLSLPSFSLVPQGDKSLLLVNSGMAPMKKWFLAEEVPPNQRVTTCQKCIRTPDIESVGITARHGTFFEMLGNFSFQDYFKREAINWAWEFFTSPEWLQIPQDKLHVSVYLDDDDAYDIWTKEIGILEDHIVRLGKKDNFWEHGSGPCGPCSEIHFDRGEEHGCGSPNCGVGCECDRFMEVWNLVFTEFNSDGAGNYTKLAKPNIDTGMGLERLACVMQSAPNLFETDTVQKILRHIEKLSGKVYGKEQQTDISIRVITDHIRSTVFMIGDGILPSNEGRGYVLRRLLRRASRHGRLLGIKDLFLVNLCDTVIEHNKKAYPELLENADYIKKTVAAEEERFSRTIEQGMSMLTDMLNKISSIKTKVEERILSGIDAFRLNDTFGFPLDLTREIAKEVGIEVDIDSFMEELQKQREKARQDRLSRDIAGWEANLFSKISADPTVFLGYETLDSQSEIVAISNGDELLDIASADSEDGDVLLVLDKTPFYAEGGGQIADTGTLKSENAELHVVNVKKAGKDYFVHVCKLIKGMVKNGDKLTAAVNANRRAEIMRNHTSAHLLQQALREVLGDHVHQAGSYVDDQRVRFDFTHFSALSTNEIRSVENIVNEKIFAALPVEIGNVSIDEAKKMGAIALFGEKYGDVVRVVNAGDWSIEFCGGTHVTNTAQLGSFKITAETSIAAGVRRIEATTGYGVLRLIDEKDSLLNKTAFMLKVANTLDLPTRAAHFAIEIKVLEKELLELKQSAAKEKAGDLLSTFTEVCGIKVFTAFLENTDIAALRGLCDDVKAKEPASVTAICGEADGKLSLVVSCGKEAIASGLKAGVLAKEIAAIAGGSGGGKPDFAMAGLKDKGKVQNALQAVAGIVQKML